MLTPWDAGPAAPDPLDSLLDELSLPDEAPVPGAAAAVPATQTMRGGTPAPIATRPGRRSLWPAGALLVLALLAGAALISRRGPVARPVSLPAVAESAPVPRAPTTSTTTPPIDGAVSSSS